MNPFLRRGSDEYHFFRPPDESGAEEFMRFDSLESASSFLRPFTTDPWNVEMLRSILDEERPGPTANYLSHTEVADRVAANLASRRYGLRWKPGRTVAGTAPTPPPPPAPTPTPPPPAPEKPKRVPISSFQVLEVRFASDHNKLKNHTADWKNAGSVFAEPEWKKGAQNHPISHTMDQEIKIEVKINVGPGAGEPQNAKLVGTGPDSLKFEKEFHVTPGQSTHTMTSVGKLPKKIHKLEKSIDWKLECSVDGTISGGSSGAHKIFVTYDTPKDDLGTDEDGVTLKRMEKSMEWVEPLATLKAHDIVAALMKKFKYYVLYPSPKVPAKFKHPSYMGNGEGGAWPMADYASEYGECQAIVRIVRGCLRQLGVPGEAKIYVVWSEPPAGAAQEADWEVNRGAGLDTTKVVGGKTWGAALVDGPVVQGKEYPPSHQPMPGGGVSPGLNRYEACLRFTADGVTKYYGGGAGVFASKDEVIKAFWGLIWVSWTSSGGYKVEEIVKRYS